MITAIQTLSQVRSASASTVKVNLLSNCSDPYLKKILKLAYDPYIIFNIGKAHLSGRWQNINPNAFNSIEPTAATGNISDVVMEELAMMSARKSVNSDDVRRMNMFFSWLHNEFSEEIPDVVEWVKAIIAKDLRCGISIKTVNKVFYNLINEFLVQLAEPCERINPDGVYFVEPKYDGVRCIVVTDKSRGVAMLFTRNGKLIEGYNDIEADALKLANFYHVDLMLDGEIVSGNFDSTMEGLFADGANKKAKLMVFDGMKAEEFYNKKCFDSLNLRKHFIVTGFSAAKQLEIKLPSLEYVTSRQCSGSSIDDAVTKTFIADGYEGAMVKDVNSLYAFKRTYDWQKLKEFHTIDCRVVKFHEGTGRNEDKLGAIEVEYVVPKTGRIATSKVGSGFSDEQRESIWESRLLNGYLLTKGSCVEVKYQEITKDGALRFPVFVRARPDKDM